jgi:phenylpropionate dioxygenase-like ring-hydroxylating dioxygenase large terminal subunit
METLPYSWYTDADVLARERERLFAHTWQYAGHGGQLAEPGSYFTLRVGEVPLVVVRDRAGTLRAFVNVCRHRGAEVVAGEGRCTTLQCHYHAWTYGLDGALRAAPRSEADPAFERGALGLRSAQVGTWGPFIFVNADAGAPPLAETLGALPEIVRSGGLDVDELAFHSRAPYSLAANWKVAVENYLECYHCAVAHPGFSDVVDVTPGAYRLEPHPTFASHYARLRGRPHDPRRDASGDVEGQFHLIWPNIKVNVMPGLANLSIGPLVPLHAERTEGYLDYFFEPDTDPAWIADYLQLDDQVGAEDRVLVESVQRGMRSGAFERGRLMLPSEALIGEFQAWVAARLDGGGSGFEAGGAGLDGGVAAPGQAPSRGSSSSHERA